MQKPGNLQLSIIIVNYNVRYFLEQCLYSVQRAVGSLAAEIRVVDNHSADDSMDVLPALFPEVIFYRNTVNLGFARANNQALADCKGDIILFLNPDTLLPEDGLTRALDFFSCHPNAGALGFRMLDGRGRYLPESKRAFPTPMASFWKLTGMAGLFPRSGFFNRYALGHLDPLQNHAIPVLAGACFFARKSILDKLGGFDERYFLYGEDIDLSHKITRAGYENWYLGEISMLHFKGESSNGLGLHRVRFFYQAMRLFVNQYFQKGPAKLFSWLLQLAILLRGLLSAVKRLIRPVFLPLMDVLLLYASLQIMRFLWIAGLRGGKDFGVPELPFLLLLLTASFLGAAAVAGLYEKRYRTAQIIPPLIFGCLVTLAVYSVLPESVRFSRGVVIGGVLLGGTWILVFRSLSYAIGYAGWKRDAEAEGQTLVAGSVAEYGQVRELFTHALQQEQILGRVAIDEDRRDSVCDWETLSAFVASIPVSCVVFCIGETRLSSLIPHLETLTGRGIRFLFHVSPGGSLVGSHSLTADAEIVKPFVQYQLADPYQLRLKRLTDWVLCIFLLLSFPFWMIRYGKPGRFFRNLFQVFTGKKTWVGYAGSGDKLPQIPKGVMTNFPAVQVHSKISPEITDGYYAKNYNWWKDMRVVFSNPGLICR
ncbi:MAG: glycosyltransferase [Bacteroidota bacterium]|nr:glycosyltransferase [Bacteroidota bacterium]